jgi:hypothetical protein
VRLRYFLSLPERCTRAAAALLGGAVYESAHLLLPRFVRRSRLYEATAQNALRITIELVGAVEAPPHEGAATTPGAGRLAAQKAAGNVVELGAMVALGFSPLWLLAGAADILNGSRVYLRTLEDELASAGLLPAGTRFESLDQLMGALSGTAGHAGGLIDLPPLELEGVKRAVSELRADAASLPTPAELAALFNGLVTIARREQRSLLAVSTGIGLAFLTSARRMGAAEVAVPYGEDWQPLRDEGFGAYAARIALPYSRAAARHFAADQVTMTERLPEQAAGWWRRVRASLRRPGR